MQWITLFQKELLENWRNYKWIWVPLVIILLAIMDPITSYYMPVILEYAGDLPEGATIELPEPTAVEAFMMSISQLNSLGILIIILMSMGTIANEMKSGISELVLVKPVHLLNYLTTKWLSLLLIVWVSLFAGFMMSWYYISILFGTIPFASLIKVFLFYGLWYSFVITLSLLFSAILNSPGLAGALSIVTTIIISTITNLFGKYLTWSPSNLSNHIQEILLGQKISFDLMMTSFITICLIFFILYSTYFIFSRREWSN